MEETSTLDWILYGSETKATFSTMAHLGAIGTIGYFATQYAVKPLWKAYQQKNQSAAANPRVERQIYQPAAAPVALASGPVVTYDEPYGGR